MTMATPSLFCVRPFVVWLMGSPAAAADYFNHIGEIRREPQNK